MLLSKHVITSLCILVSLPLAADTTRYQTAPPAKPAVTESQPSWSAPLISVDPATGKTRVFIQPDGSFSNRLASYGAPVYHARALYKLTPQGIASSQLTLHQKMRDVCAQGWIKLQEWAQFNQATATLNYQFQCLTQATPTPTTSTSTTPATSITE